MRDPLLVLEGIELRSTEGRDLFHGLDWSLERGQKVNIQHLGGGGAQALLRLAAGLETPDRGRVILDGTPFGPYAFDHPFLHRGALGWVPREGGLLVNQSLLHNVALPLMFTKRIPRAEAVVRSAEALAEAGLAELAEQRPHALEPRERWLGALVRASVMEPELWLVDAQPGNLDARTRASASAILGRAAASSAAMVVLGNGQGIIQDTWQTVRLELGRLSPGGA